MKTLSEVIIDLVTEVFEDENISIVDWDLDRVYLEREKEEFIIRMWNIREYVIDWTLFKMGETSGTEIKYGCYHYRG